MIVKIRVKEFAKEEDIIIIGNYYDKDKRMSISFVSLPEGYSEECYYEGIKQDPSRYDKDVLSGPENNEILKFVWECNGKEVYLQVLTCKDYLYFNSHKNIKRHPKVIDLNNPGIIICPMCTPEIKDFEDDAKRLMRDSKSVSIFCNNISLSERQTKIPKMVGRSQLVAQYDGDLTELVLNKEKEQVLIGAITPTGTMQRVTPRSSPSYILSNLRQLDIEGDTIKVNGEEITKEHITLMDECKVAINPNIFKKFNVPIKKTYGFMRYPLYYELKEKAEKFHKSRKDNIWVMGIYGFHDLLFSTYELFHNRNQLSHLLGFRMFPLINRRGYFDSAFFGHSSVEKLIKYHGLMYDEIPSLEDITSEEIKQEIPIIRKIIMGEYLFRVGSEYNQCLKEGNVDPKLRKTFKDNNFTLSIDAKISKIDEDNWGIIDGNKSYIIKYHRAKLNVCIGDYDEKKLEEKIKELKKKEIFISSNYTCSDISAKEMKKGYTEVHVAIIIERENTYRSSIGPQDTFITKIIPKILKSKKVASSIRTIERLDSSGGGSVNFNFLFHIAIKEIKDLKPIVIDRIHRCVYEHSKENPDSAIKCGTRIIMRAECLLEDKFPIFSENLDINYQELKEILEIGGIYIKDQGKNILIVKKLDSDKLEYVLKIHRKIKSMKRNKVLEDTFYPPAYSLIYSVSEAIINNEKELNTDQRANCKLFIGTLGDKFEEIFRELFIKSLNSKLNLEDFDFTSRNTYSLYIDQNEEERNNLYEFVDAIIKSAMKARYPKADINKYKTKKMDIGSALEAMNKINSIVSEEKDGKIRISQKYNDQLEQYLKELKPDSIEMKNEEYIKISKETLIEIYNAIYIGYVGAFASTLKEDRKKFINGFEEFGKVRNYFSHNRTEGIDEPINPSKILESADFGVNLVFHFKTK